MIKNPREHILSSLPALSKAMDFVANASINCVTLSAERAVFNSPDSELWLNSWKKNIASKEDSAILCSGDYLFGPSLDNLLERASDRKRGFPSLGRQNDLSYER